MVPAPSVCPWPQRTASLRKAGSLQRPQAGACGPGRGESPPGFALWLGTSSRPSPHPLGLAGSWKAGAWGAWGARGGTQMVLPRHTPTWAELWPHSTDVKPAPQCGWFEAALQPGTKLRAGSAHFRVPSQAWPFLSAPPSLCHSHSSRVSQGPPWSTNGHRSVGASASRLGRL